MPNLIDAHFPELNEDLNLQVHQVLDRIDEKRHILKHILTEFLNLKVEEKNLINF